MGLGSHHPKEEAKYTAPPRKDADRKAADEVFEMKVPKAGERSELLLGGLWQIARLDEQEIKDRTGPMKELPSAGELHWKGLRVPGRAAR